MARKKKTKADLMREYLRTNPNAPAAECEQDLKTAISHSHYSTLRKEIKEELAAAKKQAKKNGHKPPPPSITDEEAVVLAKGIMSNDNGQSAELLKELEKKVDEYRYRCWVLEGEKFAYVKRLLNETHF